jgi:tRNA(adenine34) deaminase
MMRRALDEARSAAAIGEVPVGAVVYRGEEVLGVGHNVRESEGDPTGHAEIVALRRAATAVGTWRLDGCTMAVTLEPCPMCAGALVNARVATLLYGAADPKMGCVDTLHELCTEPRFNHRLEVHRGVLAEESAALLRGFFAERRKKPAVRHRHPE